MEMDELQKSIEILIYLYFNECRDLSPKPSSLSIVMTHETWQLCLIDKEMRLLLLVVATLCIQILLHKLDNSQNNCSKF